MLFLSKRWFALLGTFLFGIFILLLTGLDGLILVASLGLTYYLLNRFLSQELFDSKFFKFLSAIVAYSVLLQVTILSAWLINHNFPLDQSIKLTALLILLSVLIQAFVKGKESSGTKQHVPIFRLSDFYSIGVGLFFLILILFMPAKNYYDQYRQINFPAISSGYINSSLDDSSHLSRINDRLQLNRGVLYKSNVTQFVVHQNTISTYPPSWHSANAAVIKALDPSIKVGGESEVAYVASKLFWMFVLVYLFCRVTFLSASAFMQHRNRRFFGPEWIWLIGCMVFFGYYALIEQFKEGFYSFIPLLITQLLALAFLVQLGSEKTKNPETLNYRAILPLGLVLVGSVLAWFLLLPAVVAGLIIAVFYPTLHANKPWKNLPILWNQLKPQLLIIGVSVIAILVQAMVITGDNSRTFREGVNDPGAITMHSIWYFSFILVGVLLLYGLVIKKTRALSEIAAFVVPMLGVALFIYTFQMITIHHTEYYFTKSLNTVLIIGLPMAIIGWLLLIKSIVRNHDGLNAFLISCGLLMSLPLIIGIEPLNTFNLRYLEGERALTSSESAYINKNMSERAKVPLDQRTSDTIFYIPGQQGHNIIGTNIVRSIQKVDTCDGKIFSSLLNSDESGLFNNIASCQTANITIVTNQDSFRYITDIVSSRFLQNKVIVLPIQ